MSKSLFIAVAVGGLLLLWLGTLYSCREPIEQDLETHVRQALAAPEYTNVEVRFNGRDGVLLGEVDKAELKASAEELSLQYWGVRRIINQIEVVRPPKADTSKTQIAAKEKPSSQPKVIIPQETPISETPEAATVETTTAAIQETTVSRRPFLEGLSKNDRLILRGTVPSEAFRTRLLEEAAAVYGADRILDQLETVAGVNLPHDYVKAWEYFLKLEGVRHSGFLLQAETLVLRGQVSDEAQKQRIGSRVSVSVAPLVVENQLVVSPEKFAAKNLEVLLDDFFDQLLVEFESGSARLEAAAMENLDQAAERLKKASEATIEIQGHTDNAGTFDTNQALSIRRAEAVREYLIAKGIAAERLMAKGYGESQPVADNLTVEGQQRNRRVTLKVSKIQGR